MATRTLFTCYREAVHEGLASLSIVLLRIGIGSHFLISGIGKVGTGWSAEEYLLAATGPFATFFQGLAGNTFVDVLNIVGLSSIGICLVVGLFVRISSVLSTILMLLYYFAHLEQNTVHGIIDYHLVYVLVFFVFFAGGAGHMAGLDGLISSHLKKSAIARFFFG